MGCVVFREYAISLWRKLRPRPVETTLVATPNLLRSNLREIVVVTISHRLQGYWVPRGSAEAIATLVHTADLLNMRKHDLICELQGRIKYALDAVFDDWPGMRGLTSGPPPPPKVQVETPKPRPLTRAEYRKRVLAAKGGGIRPLPA